MPIQATVILDSGCFIPLDNDGEFTEIGYFQSSDSISDIRVIVDGKEMFNEEPLNLGKRCKVEVRHVKANGKVVKDKPVGAYGFHEQLLHLRDVYGKDMPVDTSKFDCILHFDTGLFCAAMVKPRAFRKHNKQNGGKLAMMADEKPKKLKKAIAHNVHVHFKLQKGDALELVRNGEVFWTSRDSEAKDRIELEVVADNSTSEKFYVGALKEKQEIYWMPNNGDPPPMCPEPPCHPSSSSQ